MYWVYICLCGRMMIKMIAMMHLFSVENGVLSDCSHV